MKAQCHSLTAVLQSLTTAVSDEELEVQAREGTPRLSMVQRMIWV